jgi:hypothetical protein
MEMTILLGISVLIFSACMVFISLLSDLDKGWVYASSFIITVFIVLLVVPHLPIPEIYPDNKCSIEFEETSLNGIIRYYTCEQYEKSYSARYFVYMTYYPHHDEREIRFEHLLYGKFTPAEPVVYLNPSEPIMYTSEYNYGDALKFSAISYNRTESRLIRFA